MTLEGQGIDRKSLRAITGHQRIGLEIPAHQVRAELKILVTEEKVNYTGKTRGRKYWIS